MLLASILLFSAVLCALPAMSFAAADQPEYGRGSQMHQGNFPQSAGISPGDGSNDTIGVGPIVERLLTWDKDGNLIPVLAVLWMRIRGNDNDISSATRRPVPRRLPLQRRSREVEL